MSNRFALKDHFNESRLINDRLIFAALIAGLLFLIVMSRLAVLQVVEHEHFNSLSNQNRIDIAPLPPQRGLIYDRNGVILAENIPTFSLEITPENVPDLMWNLWASYNNLFDKPIEVGASINYVAERFTNVDNAISMQDYTLINMFVAYTVDNYRIALHGRNIADEIYVPWSDINYPNQLIIASPRTLELSFRMVF